MCRSVIAMGTTRTGRPPRASTIVEDFDGVPAAPAAVALRRAGLRPALERTFHWDEETHGLVVAQEPPAGSEVPLNSTVLLFVSAPGERETFDRAPEPPRCGTEKAAEEHGVEPEEVEGRAFTVRRRRRKPGLSPTGAVTGSTQAPVPVPTEADTWEERQELPWRSGETAVPLNRSTDRGKCSDEEWLLERARTQLASRAARTGGYGRMTRRPGQRLPLSELSTVATLALAVALLLILLGAHAHALQAAGAFDGTPISGVQTFVDKLRGNLVWLGGTAMGLVIAVVGVMFMAGHSRAHDLAIRTLVGLAILASISGIVA